MDSPPKLVSDFFPQDWRVVLGEFDDSKEDGWEQTFEVKSSSSDHFKLLPLAHTLSKKVKRYKVLSKKCTTKSTFHLN